MATHHERVLAEIHNEFPRFSIVYKRHSILCRAIDVALRILTLNRMTQFMTVYHTVIANTLFVPDTWDSMTDVARAILLRHERVHLRQKRRYGFLLMAFIYLIPFFPLGLAYGRARLEWEAYEETLRATAELCGFEQAAATGLRAHILERFTGPDYGWMWPFPRQLNTWYDHALAKIRRATIGQPT